MSVFYPPAVVETIRKNIARDSWARGIRDAVLGRARVWLTMDDAELWELMFGCTITRTMMVWSNGWCPTCRKGVPMYNWLIDAIKRPWKVQCPHCGEVFPKNDFQRFYRSGLDEHGVFDPKRADRRLLYNEEHPEQSDELRGFGVDDGEGYADGANRWRFIGAYLLWGQWKQRVLHGIITLAQAYLVSGDPACAHKAAILIDRVADLFPTFDYATQGLFYERKNPLDVGFIMEWCWGCNEVREMAFAYDAVREEAGRDPALVEFLSGMARRYSLENDKDSFEDVRRNIEERIFGEALRHPDRISSNFPNKDIAKLVIGMVLGWPGNRDAILRAMDDTIERGVSIDGMIGEKGLAGYTMIVPAGLSMLLALFDRMDRSFLAGCVSRHPGIRDMVRFHIDTWCLGAYYPLVGDGGYFGRKTERYIGVFFLNDHGIEEPVPFSLFSPSMYTFFTRLYEVTADRDLVRVAYGANGGSYDGLPYDLCAEDSSTVEAAYKEVIGTHGREIAFPSVNKQKWHLAVLRSGKGREARAVWLQYDSGGFHAHANGMNLGLFARGYDLMPDFGYPPVNFGGWDSPKCNWYKMTAAHNTVVVSRRNLLRRPVLEPAAGKTTAWGDGREFRAIRASGVAMTLSCRQYERTVAMVDVSPESFYVVDVFRVVGGTDHARFVRGTYGTMITEGLSLAPVSLEPEDGFGPDCQLRGFQRDVDPPIGWQADWRLEDPHAESGTWPEVHLRYTDLTSGAEVYRAEAWVLKGNFSTNEEGWIPCVFSRRQGDDFSLSSTFAGVFDVHGGATSIGQIRRLELETTFGTRYPEANVAVETELADGRRDLYIAADVENPLAYSPWIRDHELLVQKGWSVRTDAEVCLIRKSAGGEVERVAMCNGSSVGIGDLSISLGSKRDFVELGPEEIRRFARER